jgi:DTW domain-containing protein YfiP
MSKPSRRDTRHDRCPKCRINYRWCFCDHIFETQSDIKVSIIMHYTERWLTSNTAYFASLVLPECQIIERGNKDTPIQSDEILLPGHDHLYLFPTEDSKPLNEFVRSENKVHLIVPDGSWSKAKKIHKREEFLKDVPKYHLADIGESQYQLRKSPGENFVCTYEAIAHALKVLDGDHVYEDMMKVFNVFVERVLMSRRGEFIKEGE